MLEILEGYRLLDPTEIIETDDLIEYRDLDNKLIWRMTYRVGRTADHNYRYIRKISEQAVAENTSLREIPAGYRLLKPGEKLVITDLCIDKNSSDRGLSKWVNTKSYGENITDRLLLHVDYIRKIDMSTETIKVNREQYKQLFELACAPWKSTMLSKYNMSVVDEIDVQVMVIEQAMREADYLTKIKIKEILKMNPKEGTLLLVKMNGQYSLRFADGNGGYYIELKRSGIITQKDLSIHSNISVVVFDLNNLPEDLKWDKNKLGV